ncbi:transmembrane protein [Rutstroemia sp. NJR-2017a BVV2]|nr:transmembrane protein [Rutstroemia sp. NJR-2017a BVV2]
MAISYRNGVAIGELVVYIPSFFIALFLAFRHGFQKSSGWYFLIVFSLARIIGPCMQLAAINNPSVSLYTGALILQNVGLSPLILATLGLLSRVIESINRTHRTFIQTRMLKLVEIISLVGLILGIVGGVNASDSFTTTGKWVPGSLSKVGNALFIVSYAALVMASIITSFSIPHAEDGEKRILLGIAIALPFLFVRLLYAIISTFTHSKRFSSFTGSVTLLLCMSLLMELAVVVVYEGIGVTLRKQRNDQFEESAQQVPSTPGSDQPLNDRHDRSRQQPGKPNSGADNMFLNIAKKTIIGRLIMMAIPEKNDRDLEMQSQRFANK